MQFLSRAAEAAMPGHGINDIERVFRPHSAAFKLIDAKEKILSLHKQILSRIMRASQQIV